MLFINYVLTAFYECTKYENNNVHYFNINLDNRLAPSCGDDGPLLGARGPLTIFASDSSMINNVHLFCGLQRLITYLP